MLCRASLEMNNVNLCTIVDVPSLAFGSYFYNSKMSFLLLGHANPCCLLNLWALKLVDWKGLVV